MKSTVLLIILFLAACQTKTGNPVKITASQNSVAVSGLPATTLNGIKQDSLSTENFQILFPVYKMPADTDIRNYQKPITGKYAVDSDQITFTPDTAFAAGQTYFARWYRFDKDINTSDLITNRRKPGETPYTELIFKH